MNDIPCEKIDHQITKVLLGSLEIREDRVLTLKLKSHYPNALWHTCVLMYMAGGEVSWIPRFLVTMATKHLAHAFEEFEVQSETDETMNSKCVTDLEVVSID